MTAATVYSQIAVQDGPSIDEANEQRIRSLASAELRDLQVMLRTRSIDYPHQLQRNASALQLITHVAATRFFQSL